MISPAPKPEEKRPTDRDHVAIANQYAQDVVDGKISASKQVIQACERHFRDLDRALYDSDFAFRLDADSAIRPCRFLEALPHVKGRWAKQRETLQLQPWQCFIVVSIFGWVQKDDSTRRRFTEANIFVPRKNGKSFLAAGIALYLFCADGEYSAEVYFGATSLEQSKRLGFKPARAMVLASPELRRAFGVKVNVHSMQRESDGSLLKPVIAQPGDGDMASCAVIDEYHEHSTSSLLDTFREGMISRENPLALVITTAGSNRGGPCYLLQKDLEAILSGAIVNERCFAIIYGLDEGDYPFCEASLIKANPNWGVSIDTAKLLNAMNAARQSARLQNAFKTKHLNIWVNAAVGWMNMERWRACADPTLRIEDFAKLPCIEAFDLASRVDLASKVRLFRRDLEGRAHFYLFANHYLNQAAVEEGCGEHYATWAEDGWLTATPGNITDYLTIIEDIIVGAQKHNVRAVAYDPHHGDPLRQLIEADPRWNTRIDFVEVSQNTQNMSPAMKETEALVFEGRFHHDGDPVLEWSFANVIAASRPHDCIMPEKERSEFKIDPAVATIIAVSQLNLLGSSGRSIYETEGISHL